LSAGDELGRRVPSYTHTNNRMVGKLMPRHRLGLEDAANQSASD
jgi:hypothetical protein